MRKLYRVNEASWWFRDRPGLNEEVYETGPENLLHLLDIGGKYRIDDLAEGCEFYGLRPSAWEYMWKAVRDAMRGLFLVSVAGNILPTGNNLAINPLKLNKDWRWQLTGYFPQELCYVTDTGKDNFSMDWPVTASIVLLSLELNPSRVAHFVKSCEKASEWVENGGERPDMKFPRIRDMEEAYRTISAPIMLEELGE